MGIFDVVKDVAKVGAEILPIVLDNMATGHNPRKLFHLTRSRSAWMAIKFMLRT